MKPLNLTRRLAVRTLLPLALACAFTAPASADETCNSPFMSKLIKGQEDVVYV